MSQTATPRPAALAALREFDELRNPDDAANGTSMADTLARAEEATTLLKQNYTSWAREDIEKGQRHLDDATGDPARARIHLDGLFAIMHNVKGQGASFGYPLVTRIAQSLCKLLGAKHDAGEPMMRIAQAHVDALKLVLDQKIEGPGGETGEKLAGKLEALAQDLVG
jgi:Hpt domain